MKQVGKVTSVKDNICTVEFVTTVGCCGGKRAEDGSACCGNNARILSFRAHRGQHKEVKVGDQVVVESDNYMVWWQALAGLIIPVGLALTFYFGLNFPWESAIIPFPVTWGLLGIARLLFPQSTMPVITIVNPPMLTPRA